MKTKWKPLNLCGWLQDCALSYEEWPKTVVTKQTFSDSFFLIRGTDNERPIWHYIMVSASNMTALKACKEGSNIDVTDYGRIVQYINNKGEIKDMSGWGSDPPQLIQNWMDKHYSKNKRILKYRFFRMLNKSQLYTDLL